MTKVNTSKNSSTVERAPSLERDAHFAFSQAYQAATEDFLAAHAANDEAAKQVALRRVNRLGAILTRIRARPAHELPAFSELLRLRLDTKCGLLGPNA